MALEQLRKNDMMAHLLDALEARKDIGHYGRLVFAMIGRHFLSEDEVVNFLSKNPGFEDAKARALVDQVRDRDYSPPRRERILQWQKEQDFPICPGDGPDGCNVYRDLHFPEGVYQHIEQYHEQKANG